MHLLFCSSGFIFAVYYRCPRSLQGITVSMEIGVLPARLRVEWLPIKMPLLPVTARGIGAIAMC